MNKVYSSACVIIPPKDIWSPIQKIRQEYDRNIHRWMPHITLLYPFRQEIEFQALESSFSEVCKKINPFEIIFKDFSYFKHKSQQFTIWLKPEPKELIINLQSVLLKVVPECDDVNKFKGGFQPHLSVGQIQGKNTLIRTLKAVQDTWKALRYTLDRIFFISRENQKTSRFQIKKQIFLK